MLYSYRNCGFALALAVRVRFDKICKNIPMPIVLPTFTNVYCQQLTACSRVLTKDKTLLQLFEKEPTMITVATQAKKKLFIRVGLDEGAHFHVDIATRSYFGARNVPKPTHNWETVQKFWIRFLNQKIKLRGVGYYRVPIADIPEPGLIKSVSIESKSGDVGLKLTAGTITLSGAPIQQLRWSLKNEGKKVVVELETRREQVLSEVYLLDALKTVDDAFRVFVRP
jgi:hypothetical protein